MVLYYRCASLDCHNIIGVENLLVEYSQNSIVKINRIVLQLRSIEKYLDSCVKIRCLRSEDLPYIGIFMTLTLVTHHLPIN